MPFGGLMTQSGSFQLVLQLLVKERCGEDIMSSGSCTALIATTGHSSLSTLFVMQDTGLTGASGAPTILNHTSFQPFHFQMAPFTDAAALEVIHPCTPATTLDIAVLNHRISDHIYYIYIYI